MATGTSQLANKIISGAGDAVQLADVMSNQNREIMEDFGGKMGAVAGGTVMLIHEQEQKRKQREEEEKQQMLSEWNKLADQALEDGQYMTEKEYMALNEE